MRMHACNTAYNPLAGGILTGKHKSAEQEPPDGRFKENKMYLESFWKVRQHVYV
jgi:aryl-alcohol dehydrogenase-like predicted oxidoreductase